MNTELVLLLPLSGEQFLIYISMLFQSDVVVNFNTAAVYIVTD